MRTPTLRLVSRKFWWKGLTAVFVWALALALTSAPNQAQQGGGIRTPTVSKELPTEVELQLAPGSLKDAPLWHAIAELLENPYELSGTTAHDPTSATVDDSAECVALTPSRPQGLVTELERAHGPPMRLRVSDGEISSYFTGTMDEHSAA